MLEGLVKYLVTNGNLAAPTTAKLRLMLKECNEHFLGKLTGDTTLSNKIASAYHTDAATLHMAWSNKVKLSKQKSRRNIV